MYQIEEIAERIRQSFEDRTAARDRALASSRSLTRHCANAIRAIHRDEYALAQLHIDEAQAIIRLLKADLAPFPDLYYSGYTQDTLKEFAEANATFALVQARDLSTPDELGVEHATFIQGLAEAAGELRRRCMDLLRSGHSQEAERLLGCMDDIYTVLVTMDYPDGVTGGLRRLTDIVRGVTERTRGDMTISLRQAQLEDSLRALQARLDGAQP
ncbi:MAG: haloacid dehalogenase [Chloroflexota bacterium]